MRVRCPHPDCGQAYNVDDARRGETATCKRCGRTFTLEALDSDTIYSLARDTAGPGAGAEADPTIPKELGRFKIRARIGSGAFGTVYRAHDPVLDREVALKVPRAAALERPEARARFLREPKAAAQLRHPNIVPVYDAGTEGDRYYIASAYIEGRTLEDVIDERHLDFRRAARIISDLAIALDYAHRKGVIHRDVKPANIMLDPQGQALLMDFGLARLETSEEKLTQDGTVMGTPAYMAPEQADRSFGEVGPASDQYSLGVVLYELLCGETPFAGPATVLLYNTVYEEPPAPRSINPEIPRDLETICLRAIAKKPKERYRSCGALADDLRRWLADRPIRARRVSLWERCWRWCRRNPIAALSASAALVFFLLTILIIASLPGAQGVQHGPVGELAQTESSAGESGSASPDGSAKPVERATEPPDAPRPEGEISPAEAGSETVELSTDPGSVSGGTHQGEQPPPAVAPFDAATAKEHQQAWADYLGISVDREIDLGGGVKLTMVLIPPGEFLMGSSEEEQKRLLDQARAAGDELAVESLPSEGPQHRVRITKPYSLSRHEATRGQFRQFVRKTGYRTEAEERGKVGYGFLDGRWVRDPQFFWDDLGLPRADDQPVLNVSWNDAAAFCHWLSKYQSDKYHLPTEAQWEYACRAGTTTLWCCGDNDSALQEWAWFDANSDRRPHEVGQLKPNAWGLYDTHGNAWEFCADWYSAEYYGESPRNDPKGAPTGFARVQRGGRWGRPARHCRSAIRYRRQRGSRGPGLGFRPAAVVPCPRMTTGDDSRQESTKSPSGPRVQGKTDEKQPVSKAKQKREPETLSPQATAQLEEARRGSFCGIAAGLEKRPEGLAITKVFPGGGADKAGLKVGDTITAIDGRSTPNMALQQAVQLIRGPEGTAVQLTIRSESGATRDVEIIRARFAVSHVETRIVHGDFGLLEIAGVNQQTAPAVRRELREFSRQDVRGIILDLRHASGGLYPEITMSADGLPVYRK